jgi:hypothetical protein
VNLQQAEKIQQAPERILDYEYVDPWTTIVTCSYMLFWAVSVQ